jgi:hypothetical protein
MADLVEYEVARDHLGDDYETAANGEVTIVAKQFRAGDTRTAPANVVSTIVGTVLIPPGGEKAEPGHKNKADRAPKNKGEAAAEKAAAEKAAAEKAAAEKAAAEKAAAEKAAAEKAAAEKAAAEKKEG